MTRRRPRPLTFGTVLRVASEHAKALAGGTVAALAVVRTDFPVTSPYVDVVVAFIAGTGIVSGIANRKPRG